MNGGSFSWRQMPCLVCVGFLAFTPAGGQTMKEGISGRHFRAIQAAEPELARYGLDIKDYWITVWDSGSSVFVFYGEKDIPKGQRGSSGKTPSFSVELDKSDLHVLRAHFER